MKKHILMTLLALLLTGGAFAQNIEEANQPMAHKYELIVKIDMEENSYDHFTSKTSDLLLKKFNLQTLESSVESGVATFILSSESNVSTEELRAYTINLGYPVTSANEL